MVPGPPIRQRRSAGECTIYAISFMAQLGLEVGFLGLEIQPGSTAFHLWGLELASFRGRRSVRARVSLDTHCPEIDLIHSDEYFHNLQL